MKCFILISMLVCSFKSYAENTKYECEIVTNFDVGCNGVEYRLKNLNEYNPFKKPPKIGSKISCEDIGNKEVNCGGKVYAGSKSTSDECEVVTNFDVECNGDEYRLKNLEQFNPFKKPPKIGSKVSCENIGNKEVDCDGKVYAISKRVSEERIPKEPATNPVAKPKTKPSGGSEQ